MSDRWIMLLAVLAPMLCGFVGLLVPSRLALGRTLVMVVGMALSFVMLVSVGVRDEPSGWSYLPQLGIDFYFLTVRLGRFFALLVTGMGTLIAA